MRTPPPVLPPEDEAPRYKTTLFDRHGPDAALRLRAMSFALVTFVLYLLMWSLVVGQMMNVEGKIGVLLAVGLSIASAGFTAWFGLAAGAGAGAVAGKINFPSGSSTPYEEQYSFQDAMAARGDIAGALASYEAVISERPAAILPRIRAAELYANGNRDPRRAAALFREVRANPAATVRDAVYVSTRLADLYDGALNEPGRALVELRRIIEEHPQSAVAAHAREALPRLKARLAAERDGEASG